MKSYILDLGPEKGAVDALFLDRNEWTRRSILNVARMVKLSSERAIMEYAMDSFGCPLQ